MNKIETFEQFLSQQNIDIPIGDFLINLALSGLIARIIGLVYVKFGRSMSNRKNFASNFLLITLTTTVIITIVKSSLALSLGLVGALSIVRFRAAIKEPEELSYLFLCIAIGLGFGAGQRIIAISSFAFIIAIIFLTSFTRKGKDSQNLCLILSTDKAEHVKLDQLLEVLKKYCSEIQLRRVDESKHKLEVSFNVAFDDFEHFKNSREDLKSMDPALKITFLDNKGVA